MNQINTFFEKNYRFIVIFFFFVYLLVGLNIFKDYGVSCDEGFSRTYGEASFNFALHRDEKLFLHYDRYHGPVFEIFLFVVEKIFNLTPDPRKVFLMRHLLTFLMFYTGVVFFYLLCKQIFKSWKIGLLGSLFLILSPRIFAHSFFNSKDIVFLSLFIISIHTLIRLLNRITYWNIFFHALTSALLIDVRIAGAIAPFLTIGFLILTKARTRVEKSEVIIESALKYAFYLVAFVFLFWPTLWQNPLYHFKEAFLEMSRYPHPNTILYLGRYLVRGQIPWHYLLVWLGTTTPILYSILFLFGCFVFVKSLLKNPKAFLHNQRYALIFMLWFFLPVLAVIVLKSTLYESWRQMYFVYPAFLIISLLGLTSIFQYFKGRFVIGNLNIINNLIIIAVAFSLINTARFMIKYHPFEHVYFNRLAGRNLGEVEGRFDLDYWALSYKQGLEYILKNDPRSTIKIYEANLPGILNGYILSKQDRERIVHVKTLEESDYFLTNFRWKKEDLPYKNEFYSIEVDDAKIMAVYKMN